MKRKVILLSLLIGAFGLSVAFGASGSFLSAKAAEKPKLYPEDYRPCPTGIIDNDKCMECHAVRDGKFIVRETDPDKSRWYPNYKTQIITDANVQKGYFVIDGTISAGTADCLRDALRFYESKGINHIIIELQTPGGSVMEAWRTIGYMEKYKLKGWIIEVRTFGLAASAGFVIAVSGSPGHRYAAPSTEFMYHECWSLTMFAVDTPSSAEVKSNMLRHIQDTGNIWISEHTNMSIDEIHDAVRGEKMLWLRGTQALEKGVVDHLIGTIKPSPETVEKMEKVKAILDTIPELDDLD